MLRSFVLYAISKEKVESSKRFTKKRKQKYTYFILECDRHRRRKPCERPL